MIDLHSHVLPGIDDGARDLEESLLILRGMSAGGVRIVAATPHVRADHPTSVERMSSALAEVRAAVAAEGLAIDVRGGGEIALERLDTLTAGELAAFGLGGNPHLLLLETPYDEWPRSLVGDIAALRRDGFVPVLGHPERNRAVVDDPALLEDAVGIGAVVQLTAASVDGRFGKRIAACARELLERELAHLIASDAHGPGVREAGLADAVEAVGDPVLGRWLVEDVPASLLAGTPLPPRPPIELRRRGRFAAVFGRRGRSG